MTSEPPAKQERDLASPPRLKDFFKIFHHEDKVLIVISADPDAIASAVAVKRLLWRRVAHVVVSSLNQVKRPDNLQLLQTLSLKMEPAGGLNPAAFTRLIMVDSQPSHSPLTAQWPFAAIIDHHPPAPASQAPAPPAWVDIRPELGATATMMTGYLREARIKPNQKLATALFYAIKTDTQNFVRQGQLEDMKAFRWLYPLIQPNLLSEIERAPIARSSFKRLVAGLNDAVFKKNTAHTFLGKTDHADTLVIVADHLMQIKGVNRSVAAGVCGPNLVVIFRAGGSRQDVGRLASQAFGEYGSAGGHQNMARAEIPLENLDLKIRNNLTALGRFVLRRLGGNYA
ncbi:MAG: DHH family phosphoesterase [Candidatus Adiutrix sp.]|jgi:nanoRNase/pAp phosphatase (c-di-AMP/oligoRNAs hydrolase)|nr:DHH family phosphoesterase [Candidatus Adiutrix sp.]